MPETPLISAVIPTLNRPRELRLCLDGFARQTTPKEQFEVVVVDDGSTEDIAAVAAEFNDRLSLRFERRDHAGIASARNTGIELARAALFILYDDDLKPIPQLVERCLEFHSRNTLEGDVELLHFGLEREFASSPVVRWCFDRMYGFPKAPGLQNVGAFWGGAVTCKRSLFRHGLFDPAYLSVEDAEFAARISQRVDLRVHYSGYLTGRMTRGITLAQIYRREYFRGYFHFKLGQAHPSIWSFNYEPYHQPESYLLRPGQLRIAFSTARAMEAHMNCVNSAVFATLWRSLEYHAKSTGWIAAREGRTFNPIDAAPPSSAAA